MQELKLHIFPEALYFKLHDIIEPEYEAKKQEHFLNLVYNANLPDHLWQDPLPKALFRVGQCGAQYIENSIILWQDKVAFSILSFISRFPVY